MSHFILLNIVKMCNPTTLEPHYTELTELQKQTSASNQSSHSKEILATITRGHIGRYCPSLVWRLWLVSSKALEL